ncbi:MAG TPA: alpha/beta hydrolase [Cellulomonas sp.]
MSTNLTVPVLLGWRPAGLEDAAGTVMALRGQVEDATVRTSATVRAIPEVWDGSAARAATARLRGHATTGERLTDTLDLVRRVLLAACDAIGAAQAQLRRAQADAVAQGLSMAAEGEVRPPAPRLLPANASDDLVAETRRRYLLQVEAADVLAADVRGALAAAAEADADAAHALRAAWEAASDGSVSDAADRALWEDVLLRAVPAAGTDPDEVAAWWAGLPVAAQDLLVDRAWAKLGNLDGIPYPVRVRANRSAVSAALADEVRRDGTLGVRMSDLEARIAAIEASGRTDPATQQEIGSLWKQWDDLWAEREASRATARWYQELLAPVASRSADGTLVTAAGRQVVLFDVPGGRFAEVVGDISRATSVAVLVPGTGAGLGPSDGTYTRARDFVRGARPSGSLAVVTYIGGPMPQHLLYDSTRNSFADHLGPGLARFAAGLDHATGATVTVVGHSYGGSVVGAAEVAGMRVDRILHVESAGIGPGVDDPGDLARPGTPRYSMTAPGDPIGLSQGVAVGGLGHGADPDTFPGVVRLETGLVSAAHPEQGVLQGASAHSDVFNRGSTAWNNMLAVMTGGEVSLYTEPMQVRTPQGLVVHTGYPMEDPGFEPPRVAVR